MQPWSPSDAWFRSYDYGFVHRGVCLWWRLLGDGRVHVAAEYVHQYVAIPEICREIRRISRALSITRCRYTVADRYSMGHRHSDDSGETRADLFSQHAVPLLPALHDRIQGWTRVRELLTLRPDGLPWMTIDPDARYLIRTLAAAISSASNPEDVKETDQDHALSALRYGAMSLPSLHRRGMPPLPPRAAGRHLRELQRRDATRPFAFH